jgi:hypothetical protein
MLAQSAEVRQYEKTAGTAPHFFVFERPRSVMRDEHSVQPRLERGIDIAAGTVANHPPVRFYDVVPVHELAVGGGIFFGDNLDRVEMNLQPRPLDLGRLLGRFALSEKNQAVPPGKISKRFEDAVHDIWRCALEFFDAVMDIFDGRALGLVPREPHVRFLEGPAEAAHTIAMLPDVAALGFVQDVAGIFSRIAEGFEQGQKFLDGLLEVNVVLPERVVGIDQNGFSGHDFRRA